MVRQIRQALCDVGLKTYALYAETDKNAIKALLARKRGICAEQHIKI